VILNKGEGIQKKDIVSKINDTLIFMKECDNDKMKQLLSEEDYRTHEFANTL